MPRRKHSSKLRESNAPIGRHAALDPDDQAPLHDRRRLVARAFHVELIKPSHYDDDGYVIQWWKASIPSNSLASLYAIVQDAAARHVLGDDVALTFDGWDECNTVISEKRVARRI